MKSSEFVSSPSVNPRLENQRFLVTINTEHERLYSVSCLSGEEVWTRGNNNIMKLFNLDGKLLSSIKTKSKIRSRDIAVTRGGDLVYTDSITKTVNQVRNEKIQTLIRLQGWKPLYVCCTASDDLLVTMISDDYKEYKVVRYVDSIETQSIQFDDQGQPLYSSDIYPKYIIENRNLDICVADFEAGAVVVVNQSGKLRFKYTGHPSNTKTSFLPVGIATDSKCHILIANYCANNYQTIHILDHDGQFLSYINNLHDPWGLCVDTRDNLIVADRDAAEVRKLQYL